MQQILVKVLSDSELLFVAEENARQLGRMTVETRDTVWFITDLYVSEENRRKGVATSLVQHVIRMLDTNGIFLPVEAVYGSDDQNAVLDAFFRAQGNFSVDEEDGLVRLSAARRSQSAAYQKLLERKANSAECWSGLEEAVKKEFLTHLAKAGQLLFVEELIKDGFAEDLSYAVIKGGRVETAVFLKEHSPGEFELAFLYSRGKDAYGVLFALSAAAKAFEAAHPDAELWFDLINEDVAKLAEGLFGDGLVTQHSMIARWNGLPVQ